MTTTTLHDEEFWWLEFTPESEKIKYIISDAVYNNLEVIWIDVHSLPDCPVFEGAWLNAPNLKLISITTHAGEECPFFDGIRINAPNLNYLSLEGNGSVKCFELLYDNLVFAPVFIEIRLCKTGLTRIPGFIFNCKMLQGLTFRKESFTELPAELFNLDRLRKLRFEYFHEIKVIPDEIKNLVNLEYFGLWGADLKYISPELFNLPKLRGVDFVYSHYEPTPELLDNLHHFTGRDHVHFGPWENFKL